MMKPSMIAGWPTNNLKVNPKALDSTDILLMGLEFSQKPGVDLIRNCDLPPPQKIFTTSDKTATASMAATHGVKGLEEVESGGFGGGSEEKLELLKALRLSQTRAREAERKAAKLMEERDCISRAFEDEARLIFCYRQSVKLLEFRVSKLQKWQEEERERNGDSDPSAAKEEEDEEEDYGEEYDGGGGMKWVWALALCLSVVGVGFLLGYRCNIDEGPIVMES